MCLSLVTECLGGAKNTSWNSNLCMGGGGGGEGGGGGGGGKVRSEHKADLAGAGL